jgi:glycosyltransferase involved in cell wall biosynthesis
MRNLIVIPAYNEEEALPATAERLQRLPAGFEVLVVNDGSKDRTKDVANALALSSKIPLHVAHLPVNCGIGVAVQTGYRFAVADGGYRYVIQFDADGQHDADYVAALVEQAESQQLDLCVGSRFINDFGPGSRSTFSRRIGIRFFAWLIGAMSGAKVTDPTSGFRCLGPKAWRRFADSYPEDYPEPESLFWCARNKLRVGELPVRMFERQGGVSSIRKLKAAYYMLKVSLAIVFDSIRRTEVARVAVAHPTA